MSVNIEYGKHELTIDGAKVVIIRPSKESVLDGFQQKVRK